ncbi:hypothetical protein [Streptomyces griseosporeus]|uniref:hypothetical protein n=1 Tax=Streptomyces griseosporeus TaxID=1910 RepID=UPI00167CB2B0|nr:hypothetical protein [Streptomyces griseosporeus]GHF68488.1 hypothetical protein GCM10018783_42330 [Streptomyces griseosporeus]
MGSTKAPDARSMIKAGPRLYGCQRVLAGGRVEFVSKPPARAAVGAGPLWRIARGFEAMPARPYVTYAKPDR